MFKRGTNTRQTDGSTELGQQSRVESGDARTQGRPGESRPVESDRAESNPVESRPLESPGAQERAVERTREVPVATAPVGHDEVVARGKEQYGGIKTVRPSSDGSPPPAWRCCWSPCSPPPGPRSA